MHLGQIENEHHVKILFACESGSRAWGFASPDSDWDVRFIYVHPRDWYLSIESRRDVIEAMLPNDIDLAGWDLRKALGLLRKSNPSFLEWLNSPIVYKADPAFVAGIGKLADKYRSSERLFHHYRSMAMSNYKSYLTGDAVAYKKYLYVLRPLLACRWIEERGTVPPVVFHELVEAAHLGPAVKASLVKLLKVKAKSSEVAEGSPIPELHAFIEAELAWVADVKLRTLRPDPVEPLDQFFRSYVMRGS